MQALTALPLVLGLELSPGQALPRHALDRDQAAELAALVAQDLHALLPGVDGARMALAGALLDPVQLLRPGFAVWSALDELVRRVPRGHLQNVVAFGSHEGRMPVAELEPESAHAGGALQLLPLCLLAEPELAQALSETLEVQLVGRGEAGTRTADWIMRTLGVRLEHARYLSRGDLLAMICVQYEYVNLAALWSMLEVALLAPASEEQALTARGLSLRFAQGTAWAQPPSDWLRHASGEPAERAHALAGLLFELRQYAALLEAHQVPLRLDPGASGEVAAGPGYVLEQLAPATTAAAHSARPVLLGHEAPGLGVVAVTVLQPGAQPRALAHGYPLAPGALGPLVDALATRFGAAAELHALGRIELDAQGQLGGMLPSAP